MYETSLLSSEQVDSVSLTPHGRELLEALRNARRWINRAELARRVGKTALNKWDVILLGKLTDAGLIETTQTPRHGPIGYEWKYRAMLHDPGQP